MVDPPLSVDSSMVTVAVVVPEEFRVQIHWATPPAMLTHEPTESPEVGLVPAVTVNRAQIAAGADPWEMYQGFGVEPDPPTVAL
jgi:hypothetical protein